jgi:UDP-N-acetylbacillosamine N-acetyltransferase
MSKLAVYGASGHGKVVADIAKRNGYKDILFIDDGDNSHIDFETFSKEYTSTYPIALGIGDNYIRSKVFEKVISYGFDIITLIDPSAVIAPSVKIDAGVVIMPQVVINSDVYIAKGAIINSGAVIEHDVEIGDFSHISPNVALAGGVKVGDFTHIGIGSSVIQNISIGDDVIVGAGSVVIKDIEDDLVVVGNPAHKIKVNDGK